MPHQCTTCGRTFEDGSKEMLSGCPNCGGNKFQFQPAGAVKGSAGGGASNASGGVASAATAPKKTPENTQSNAPTSADATNAAETSATDAPETEGDSRASAVNRAAATVRDWVGKRDDNSRDDPASGSSRSDGSRGTTESPRAPDGSVPSAEDSAQASARRDVVSEAELPEKPPQSAPQTDPNAATADPNASAANAPPDPDADVSAPKSDANVVDTPDDQNPGLKELREELNSQFESIRIEEPGQYELNLMELYEREEYIISLQEDGKYIIEVPDAWDANDR